MPIDASIYQNFLRPPKTVQEFDNEAQAAEGNKLGLQQQRMQVNALQRQQQDDQLYRDTAKGFGADSAANALALRQRGLASQAQAYEKAALDAQKIGADIKESGSKAKNFDSEVAKRDFEMAQAKTQQHLQQVTGIRTVQDAHAWLDQAAASGELPLDRVQAVKQKLAQNPQSLEQWKQGAVMGGLTLMQQREDAMKQQEFGLRANNELIGPDGKINQTLLGAKKQVAQAGAPVQSSVTYQVDGQGNLVALPTKIPNGSGSVSSVPVMSGGQPVQGVGKDKPLPEAAQKQVMGARNLQDAVGGYLSKLDGWSNAKMLSPDQRAEMGNAYNNMMLQAKEAYNLGVLNGPDYDILQSVVKDPTKLTSILTSNEALSGQAKSLRSIAANIEKTALESHGKKYTPRDQSASAGPKPGAVEDGHRFKGGDPSNPSNWEKVK